MIYFDNNATTKFSLRVQEYLRKGFIDNWGNASSEHLFGQTTKDIIEGDREYIANFLNVLKKNILFTSGATESINSILNPIFCSENKITSVISSKLEHQSTLSAIDRLKKHGVKILWVKNDENGVIDLKNLESLAKQFPQSLASFLYVNNETGVIQDVKTITRICKEFGCLVHLDSVQALGKYNFDLLKLGVDFASFSAHKIGGLKGVGLLYIKNPDNFVPFILGGGQEQGLRAGTYNINGIRSFRFALEDSKKWNLDSITNLRNKFEEEVLKLNDKIKINCQNANRICNTSNIYFPNLPNQAVALDLSRNNICVSTGSACSSGTTDPSYVIQGLGQTKNYASSCIRFSFAYFNIHNEVNRTIEALKQII